MQWGRKKKPKGEQSAPPHDQQDWVDGSSVVIPAITLPSMPSVRAVDPGETPTSLSQFTPRQRTTARPLSTLGSQSGLPPLDEQTLLPVPPLD